MDNTNSMKITSIQFVRTLQKTSLSIPEQRAIVNLLRGLTFDEIEDLFKILLEDSKKTERILKKLEMENQKKLIELRREVEKVQKEREKAEELKEDEEIETDNE